MITFNVVKETHGWAVRMDQRMTTPFWSRDSAIEEAHGLADAIRRHGECARVVVEGPDPSELRLANVAIRWSQGDARTATPWARAR